MGEIGRGAPLNPIPTPLLPPHTNAVSGYLTDQFDLNFMEPIGDTILQQDTAETIPYRPVGVCLTSTSIPITMKRRRQTNDGKTLWTFSVGRYLMDGSL